MQQVFLTTLGSYPVLSKHVPSLVLYELCYVLITVVMHLPKCLLRSIQAFFCLAGKIAAARKLKYTAC